MSNIFFKGPRENVMLPLTAEFLTGTGGTYKVNFRARFRRPEADERKDVQERASAKAIDDEQVVSLFLLGWADVQDSENNPIEFSPEALTAAMQVPEYREALVQGALTMVYGKKVIEQVARAKNSQTPAATG